MFFHIFIYRYISDKHNVKPNSNMDCVAGLSPLPLYISLTHTNRRQLHQSDHPLCHPLFSSPPSCSSLISSTASAGCALLKGVR